MNRQEWAEFSLEQNAERAVWSVLLEPEHRLVDHRPAWAFRVEAYAASDSPLVEEGMREWPALLLGAAIRARKPR